MFFENYIKDCMKDVVHDFTQRFDTLNVEVQTIRELCSDLKKMNQSLLTLLSRIHKVEEDVEKIAHSDS